MKFQLSDGNTMAYGIAGQGPMTFLCIHGGGGDRSHLEPQFSFLSSLSCAINVDLRGYGKSDSLTQFGTIEQYAEDLHQLISNLNISQVILVGHSMGGMVAVEFAHRYPGITNAIIMISSGIIFPKAVKDDENNFLQKLNGPEFEKALTELVTQLMPYNEHYQEIKDSFFAVSQIQWVSHFESVMKWDKTAKSCLKSCTMPMLYIQDSGGCYSDLKSLKAICPQLVVGRVVGSGHFPTIDVPDQVNAMIQRFVELTIGTE